MGAVGNAARFAAAFSERVRGVLDLLLRGAGAAFVARLAPRGPDFGALRCAFWALGRSAFLVDLPLRGAVFLPALFVLRALAMTSRGPEVQTPNPFLR